jgi:hypothetical protein
MRAVAFHGDTSKAINLDVKIIAKRFPLRVEQTGSEKVRLGGDESVGGNQRGAGWGPPFLEDTGAFSDNGAGDFSTAVKDDCVVKKPKTAIVIPRSLRRGISSIRYYYTFRFTKRSLAALGMTIRIFYESIKDAESWGEHLISA